MDKRLNVLAEMVPAGSRVADIGTDHAYLPIALVRAHKITYAIASDIAQGPLNNAVENIAVAGLQKQIDPRLGAGLSTITVADQIDTVVIAGMGGKLITTILADAWSEGFEFPTLILEGNVGEPGIRSWLVDHCYDIASEKLLAEAGHTYEIIKAQKITHKITLTDRELLFGPVILQNKDIIFEQKWQSQLAYLQKLVINLNKAKQKDTAYIAKIEHEITLLKKELS